MISLSETIGRTASCTATIPFFVTSFKPLATESKRVMPPLTNRWGTLKSCCVQSVSQCRSEEHTSELRSLMRISYAVFCLKKKKAHTTYSTYAKHRPKSEHNKSRQ